MYERKTGWSTIYVEKAHDANPFQCEVIHLKLQFDRFKSASCIMLIICLNFIVIFFAAAAYVTLDKLHEFSV